MVRLTEEMLVARTRVSDFSAVKKLNCWGTELTDVTILRRMKNVEVLSLSVNNIGTLADFQYCLNLKDLFVRKNNIKDLNEVCYLQGLPNLRNLWLGENPCADKEGYRMSVLRALPNLEKLDDKIVTEDEVQTALTRGRVLVHPLLDIDASPTQSNPASPEEVVGEYIEEPEPEQQRRYSSSSDQRSYEDAQHAHDEYHDTDRRNANYNASPPLQYQQNNQYTYEDYDDRPAVPRHNGDYDARRAYPEYANSDLGQRGYAARSPGTQYPGEFVEDRRVARSNYDYEDRRQLEYEEPPPAQHRQATAYQNIDREDTRSESSQLPGWVRQPNKEKCRFHYQRRPVTRNSNILSAVLCLVKELDFPSLEVVEMAVRNRMDELEE